ncbi:DNA/RNA non-specific endonuclease [Bradyrhizobium sp. NBAIM01]|uniref:DNA/RNA non-specific endonuclease n=1 Tax=Bradyrhizobium sp. NBAIM01 TaxID=2793818 RepID=UPI001CD4AF46|nr:DNA/RNA non-specific endonuclease [Bradyrhizobium sp. NBAIM01]MCA1510185.1 DNA/RNA non-specific endonuclease [Bradyrhizobium sp. NBAIM01]
MTAEMDNDPDFNSVFLERAAEAAKRWRERTAVREQKAIAVEEGRALAADTPPRVALRLNRLIDQVRKSVSDGRLPDNPTLQDLINRPTPLAAEDLNEQLVQEVVLGVRNFLSVEFLARGIQASRRVGRILIDTGGGLRARGTGFLIGNGVVLTNEHVLRTQEQAATCFIQMDYEQNRFAPNPQPQLFAFEPDRLFLNSRNLDFAIVAVAPRSNQGAGIDQYGWLALNEAQGKITVTPDDFVNIIQHPLGREKEVVVRDNRLLDLSTSSQEANSLGPFLHYEADTEKGSSGSPVLNDQWEVVALHHTGVPVEDAGGHWLDKEGKVWDEKTQSSAEIAWRANEGVRVSSLIAELSQLQLSSEQKALLAPVLNKTPPPLDVRKEAIELRKANEPVGRRAPDRLEREQVAAIQPSVRTALELEIPLRISLAIGEARQPLAGTPIASAPVRVPSFRGEILEERLEPEEYADREGYDRRFLGVNVPFPTMKAQPRFGRALRVPRPARPRDTTELRYHRFSIIMNERRRIAYVSACNVNFNPPESVSRDEGGQSWRLDPRIDPQDQLGASYYNDNDYDKGHLTRRDDAAWGSDKEDALAANWDTFHYTNAAPQHYLLNRSTDFTGADLDLWGDLENFISEQGGQQRTRLSVFNGPIFGDRDKKLDDARVPWAFFKIVIWRDRNERPGAIGFVLSQRDLIENLAEEAIDPGRFSIRQKRISQIERDLDISFGPVTEWDQMLPRGAEESLDEEGIEITRVSDILIRSDRPTSTAVAATLTANVRNDALSEAIDIQGGVVQLDQLARVEYHQSLQEIVAEKDKERAARRLGRLVGVVLKEPFATPSELKEKSRRTSAYRSWELKPQQDFEAAAKTHPEALKRLEWLRGELSKQGMMTTDSYQLALQAHHESGFFALLMRVMRGYICGDPKIRKMIDEAFKKIGKLGKAPTPETVVGAGGLTLGAYLVQLIPALGMLGAPVIAALILILYLLGSKAFCEWSGQLNTTNEEEG